jgi:hypothetical protein
VCFVRNRREHLVRIAKLRGDFEHCRMMEQRTIEHAMLVDDQTIVDIEARVED